MATTTAPVKMTPTSFAARPCRARWVIVRVETDTAVYVGRAYVPESKKRFSDMLCDERPFLNLTEVTMSGNDGAHEPYVAISKRYIRTVRVLHEGEPEVEVVPVAGFSGSILDGGRR